MDAEVITAVAALFGNTLAVVAAWLAAKLAAETVHTIVNSQRTVMLRALHVLTARIALENPADANAQLAAEKAARDLEDAERAL